MKRFSKFISAVLCLTMAPGMAACGGSSTATTFSSTAASSSMATTVDASAAETSSEAAESKLTASDGKEVDLSVILINGYEFYQDAIKEYCEKNPNIKVDVQTMDTDSYKTIIKTKFASNDAPDIIPVFPESDYFSYYDNGYLADLSDMTETLDRLNDGAIDSFKTKDSGVLGIPYTQQFLLAYYNKDIFDKYNLKAPTPYEEFLEVCKTLKDNGVTPIAQGFKDTWVTQMFIYSLNATNVQAADPTFYQGTADGTNKFADNKGWLDTLTKLDELVKAGYINDGSLSMTSDQMYEMFNKGEAAMTFTGTWGDTNIYSLNPSFAVGGFPIPAEGGNKGVSVSISGGLGISKDSKNIDEAKKLLTFILSKECMEKYGSTVVTCFKDVNSELSDALKEASNMMKGIPGYQFDNTYFASGVQEIMFSSIQEMIDGSKTPQEVLEDMDAATAKANK